MQPIVLSRRRVILGGLVLVAVLLLGARFLVRAGTAAATRCAADRRLGRERWWAARQAALRRRRPGSSSTWSAPSGGRGSTGFPPGRGSPTRSRAPAAPRGGPTLRRSTSPPRWRTASRCSCPRGSRARSRPPRARPCPVRPVGPVQLSVATAEQLDALPGIGPVTAQKIIDYRTAHGALRSVDDLDDDPGNRACASRAAAGAGGAVRRVLLVYPYVLAGAACVGLALSNAARVSALAVAAPRRRRGVRGRVHGRPAGAGSPCWRSRSCSQAGGGEALRLNAIDSSVLAAAGRRGAAARVVVTGPARAGDFDLRVPAKLTRFGSLRAGEPVLLELPLGRAPPQGAILELDARLQLPRPASNGFDERTWLRRHGVHVVVQAARLAHRRPAGRDRRLRGPRPRAGSRARSHPGSRESAARSSKASCSARTRTSRRASRTPSGPRGSTTCWR